MRACAFVCRQRSIQRVIILNAEIKGLQTSSVIQLSISQLISKQRRGEGRGGSRETERGRREVNVSSGLDSTCHANCLFLFCFFFPQSHFN